MTEVYGRFAAIQPLSERPASIRYRQVLATGRAAGATEKAKEQANRFLGFGRRGR